MKNTRLIHIIVSFRISLTYRRFLEQEALKAKEASAKAKEVDIAAWAKGTDENKKNTYRFDCIVGNGAVDL